MSATQVGAITLFVGDVQRSKSFYDRAFGVAVVHEDEESAVLQLENTLLNLLRSDAASELIEPAQVGTPGDGARLLLTIWVDDADAAAKRLVDGGISLLNGPLDRPWGVRTAAFADPDGHVWELAQRL